MSDLIIHAGGRAATLDEIANVPTPAASATHFPIPHIAFIEEVKRQLDNAGLNIVKEQHALHTVQDVLGANYFGLLEMEARNADYALVVGLRGSHVMNWARGIALGSHVFVCDNLAFSGEVVFQRRHTKNILRDLPQVAAAAIGNLNTLRLQQDKRIAAYKAQLLTQAIADHAIIDLLRARAISSKDVLHIVNEFEKPSHVEHLNEDGAQTVWTLFNAVTEDTRGSNLFTLPKRTQALHAVCDGIANVYEAEFEVVQEFAEAA